MRYPRYLQLLPLALALSTAAHAQTSFETYRLTRLDNISGASVGINDINEQGEMVGFQFDQGRTRGVLLRDGMVIDLGDLMGGASMQTIAVAINELTQITGHSTVPDPSGQRVGLSRGFLWEAGQIRDLGIDPNVRPGDIGNVLPSDINDRGEIVGTTTAVSTENVFSSRPFLWKAGRTTFLELPACPTPNGSALAINENGVIVGSLEFRAAIWRSGEVMVLEPTQPLAFGEAVDVNDRDEVIGNYFTPEINEPVEIDEINMAFLWHDGGVVVLPPGQGVHPFAVSINNAGQVVGHTTLSRLSTPDPGPPTFERATLWQDGVAADLTDLISDDDPGRGFVTLRFAFRIFDSGVIVVNGQDSRDASQASYFLTPTGVSVPVASPPAPSPPPSSTDTDGASGTDSGGGAVDLLSLVFLMLGLSSFVRSQSRRCAGARVGGRRVREREFLEFVG